MKRCCAVLVLLLLLAGPGCGEAFEAPPPVPDAMRQAAFGLTPEQKLRADRLISVFENDTPDLQYGYVEALGDGRGFTCGRAGFTTADGDAREVVEAYAEAVPDAPLATFLPVLRRLEAARSDDVSALPGFEAAWAAAAGDRAFRDAQDRVSDRLYYRPAMDEAERLGLETALARFALYDAVVQHGEGDDPDGLPALVARTGAQAAPPVEGGDEAAWLARLLRVRRGALRHAHDPATRTAWAASTDRVAEQQTLLAEGWYDLHGPVRVETPSFHHVVP